MARVSGRFYQKSESHSIKQGKNMGIWGKGGIRILMGIYDFYDLL